MARVSSLLLVPPLAFAFLVVLFLLGMNRDDPDALPTALAGKPAPEMTLAALGEGPVLTTAMLTGPGVKLVNFWASWCAPCRVEHPNLQALADEGIPVFGVNYKDDPVNALGFLAELGNPYAALGADRSGRGGLDWGVYGVPETFVIDGRGRIVLRIAGPLTRRILDGKLRPVLEADGS